MSKKLFLFVYVVFVYSIFAVPVNGAESSAQEQPQIFTNQDIEKYSSPSDAKTTDTKTVFQEDRNESVKDRKKRSAEEHEMEYWCERATVCNRKIEDEKEAIKEIEDEIFEAKTKGRNSQKTVAALDKKLVSAKKRLKKAEGDLNTLENEAHRKGALPGWLRCQI